MRYLLTITPADKPAIILMWVLVAIIVGGYITVYVLAIRQRKKEDKILRDFDDEFRYHDKPNIKNWRKEYDHKN